MSDPTDRLLTALEESSRVTAEVQGHIKGLSREVVVLTEATGRGFQDLRETFDRQLGDLEDEMKSTNAHLDNLVRETVVTNELLREDQEDRKAAQEHRRNVETEERDWRRKMEERRLDRTVEVEDANREDDRTKLQLVQAAGGELWGVFKTPFGYLITGIIAWILYWNFAVLSEAGPPASAPTPPAESSTP